MCRKNQLLGFGAIAFGMGLLIGSQIVSGFWCVCFSLVAIGVGFTCIRK